MVGDIGDTLRALLPRVAARDDSTFRDDYVKRHARAIAKQAAHAAAPLHKGRISGTYLTSLVDKYADDDALFAGDDGSPVVWLHRIVKTNGKRKLFGSLLHGTMACAVPTALRTAEVPAGAAGHCAGRRWRPGQLLGDVLTTIQEKLPIKIACYDNGKLGFVEIEQETEGMMPTYTDLHNPTLGEVAKAMGLWGRTVTRADELDDAVQRGWPATVRRC